MIFKNDMLLYGWNPPGGIFGREFKLVADVPAAARPKKQQHCLRKRTRRMCVTEGTLHATTTHNWSLLSPRHWLENLVFPGINDKGTIPRMQYITIRASPRWKRGENICQSQDKREVGKRIACSNQTSAIHIQKASLHLTTHIPCVPPGASPYMSAASPLLSPEGKTDKRG